MKRICIFLLIFFCSITLFADWQLTYKEANGDEINYATVTINQLAFGFRVHKGANICWLDNNGQTYKWQFNENDEQFEVIKIGNKITIKGSKQGKKINKEYKSNHPWFQTMDHCLEFFARSDEEKIVFCFIRDQELVEFEAKKIGLEYKAINGKKIQAVHIRINPTGIAALFWHADYWFRAADGRYLRYETNDWPAGSAIIFELIHETNIEEE